MRSDYSWLLVNALRGIGNSYRLRSVTHGFERVDLSITITHLKREGKHAGAGVDLHFEPYSRYLHHPPD